MRPPWKNLSCENILRPAESRMNRCSRRSSWRSGEVIRLTLDAFTRLRSMLSDRGWARKSTVSVCNELSHVRPTAALSGFRRIVRRIVRRIIRRIDCQEDCQGIVRRIIRGNIRRTSKGYLQDIKVGEGCGKLRSLTEQLVYLRLATIVLVYCRTQSQNYTPI
jgi:hypothetical protein